MRAVHALRRRPPVGASWPFQPEPGLAPAGPDCYPTRSSPWQETVSYMRVARSFSAALIASASGLAAAAAASAQTAPDAPVERIVVLGGRAPVADIDSRPVETLGRTELTALGQDDLADSLAWLNAVVGSEFNEDPGTQNDTSGTSSVNLRGLGLGATLILVNGQRQTEASVAADDGARFVDLNAVAPDIAVAGVAVLKDGASPVYGSDAVAGVIDIRTRDRFEGVEIEAGLRQPTRYDGSGASHDAAFIAGRGWRMGGMDVHVVAAADYLDREGLEGFETEFVPGTGLSSLGQPGAYNVELPDGSRATVIDRDCEAGGGQPLALGPETPLGTPGFCRLDFGQFFSILPEEERLRGFAAVTVEGERTRLILRASGADSDLTRGNSPSLPNLNFPTLPASLPGNYFGQDVTWFGRPIGVENGAARRRFEHRTWRIAGELSHELTALDRDWTLQLDAAYSRNDLRATITDTLAPNFELALQGLGGADCAAGATPGDQSAGCFFFNPFGSGSLIDDPSDPRFNAPQVLDFIIGEDVRESDADLSVIELAISTAELFDVPAGPVSAAFGAQTRRETLAVDHGEDFNADRFLFIIGGPDFSGARDAQALFADIAAPLTERVELQAALRHEDIEGLSSTDPRLALVRRGERLTLRGSWSQSFRAPSLHQQVSATTTLESLAVGDTNLFRPVRTIGDPDLEPEEADTFTLGAVLRAAGVTATLDLWRTEVDNLIVEESANAIIAADLADGVFDDPRIDVSETGEVTLVRAAFVNAPKVSAQGADLALQSSIVDLGRAGEISASFSASYIHRYEITDPVLGVAFDASGNRNFTNFARSLPKLRANAAIDWRNGALSGRLGLRHVGSYDDDENGGREIDAWTVLDARLSADWPVPGGSGAQATIGVLNLFDEQPPFVATPLGYDTKIHDARGRVAYVRIAWRS